MAPITAKPETLAPALRGYFIALISTAVLSTTGILIKYLLVNYPIATLTLALWRVAFVTLGLVTVLAIFRPALLRVHRRDVVQFALLGVAGIGVHQIVWVSSVAANGAAVATVLVSIQPAIVALISWRLLGESLGRVKMISLALTLTGVVLVSRIYGTGLSNLNLGGILLGVGSGFTWAMYALLSRHATRRYSAWTSLFYAFFFGTLFLLPLQFVTFSPFESGYALALMPAWQNLFSIGGQWSGWGMLLLLALGPTLTGFALYTIGLSHLPAS
ncbi:MAG: DMT family transporter, partial [Rudaea sp.]